MTLLPVTRQHTLHEEAIQQGQQDALQSPSLKRNGTLRTIAVTDLSATASAACAAGSTALSSLTSCSRMTVGEVRLGMKPLAVTHATIT